MTLNLGNVLANDTDPDNDVLFVSEVNGLASGIGSAVAGDNGGLFTIHADGTVDFDSTGIDLAGGTTQQTSISYTVNDGNGGTDTATLTVTIVGANNAPEAADDLAAVVGEDSGNVVVYSDITANDDDLEGDSLTVTRIGLPGGPTQTVAPGGTTIAGDAGGLFTVFPNGEVQFDPNGEFENLDVGDSASTRISYIVSDGHGGTSTAIVTVTVEGADDPAVGLAVTSAESDVVDIVTVVDDPDGPVVLKSVVGVTESRNATIATPVAVTDLGNGTYQLTTVDGTEITLNADGTAAVNSGSTDLSLGESNVITLTLMVNDGTGGESDQEVTATITLVGGNDNPIAVSDTATPNALALVAMQLSPTYVGNVLTGAVDASFAGMSADHDPDALDTLKVVGVGVSGSGMITDGTGVGTAVTVDGVQITISDTGEVTAYVVTLNLAPAVTVDYTISDGKGGFAVAQLTLSGLTVL